MHQLSWELLAGICAQKEAVEADQYLQKPANSGRLKQREHGFPNFALELLSSCQQGLRQPSSLHTWRWVGVPMNKRSCPRAGSRQPAARAMISLFTLRYCTCGWAASSWCGLLMHILPPAAPGVVSLGKHLLALLTGVSSCSVPATPVVANARDWCWPASLPTTSSPGATGSAVVRGG